MMNKQERTNLLVEAYRCINRNQSSYSKIVETKRNAFIDRIAKGVLEDIQKRWKQKK